MSGDNPDVKFERNAKGELIVMPATGGETGKCNAKLTTRFILWNEQTQFGKVFDFSTCFKLPPIVLPMYPGYNYKDGMH
ncbi:Uma2 family endonuclease [Nostoc sp.]|uniref:Uma2 family endonuclease n=1 Tax=Nostoc sp. TaxID=1180 RepID=UPI003FA56DEA